MASFLKRLFSGSRGPARTLYNALVEQSRRPEFFLTCGVPDTPNGRFEVVVLHLFILMQRLKADDELAGLARSLSEVAVQDIDRNLREMGVGDLSVGRKVKSLTEGMYGRFGAYTDGLEAGELREALKRNLYSEASPEDEMIDRISDYLCKEIKSLEVFPSGDLQAGRVVFGDPPGNIGNSA